MKYWLMKAEPNSRIEKGKDVKFSVDDFESVKTTAWEGVRNNEAKNLMQSMKVGDQVLFYHSNCKNPGIAGFAEISKEAYPDYTAWDPEHPYYDPKSDKDSPKWFMVDAAFKSRATHFVPLTLFKRIANQSADEPPGDVAYIGSQGVQAIKEMALIKRARLSVQPVEEDAWKAVQSLAENGGWESEQRLGTSTAGTNNQKRKKRMKKGNDETRASEESTKGDEGKKKARGQTDRTSEKGEEAPEETEAVKANGTKTPSRKRKAEVVSGDAGEGTSSQRSTRSKR